MRRFKAVLPILAAIIATWVLTPASAQGGIPDGVFVRQSGGTTWLVLK